MAVSLSKDSFINHLKYAKPMIIVTLLTLAIDQITKTIIRKTISFIGTVEVIKGFFEINYSENTGAVFGMFRGQNNIFVLVSIVAIIFIFIYYNQFKHSLWMKIALGFILGGALGNLFDRIFFGFVTDFLRIKIWFFRFLWWPNFNLADAGVCIGAVMLIIGMSVIARKNEGAF